jgi:uncharacterized protein YpbB
LSREQEKLYFLKIVGEISVKNYLLFLMLFCLLKLDGQRTIYSIYHLLKGKKSSQTIQDAHLFQLTGLFQTFPQLNRVTIDEITLELEGKEYIHKIEGEKYKITIQGKYALERKMKEMPIPSLLRGWNYCSFQEEFWKRLSLLVQVGSNLINFEPSYIPIHNDQKTSEWLKTTLRDLNLNRETLAAELLKELIKCLNSSDAIKQEVLVTRLTGYKHIGLTAGQTAEALNMDPAYLQLEFLNTIHFMINHILTNQHEYSVLPYLVTDFEKPIILTHSTSVTYQSLIQGYSIEQIAAMRNLKISTIEDHVVEIVLNDKNLPLDSFVPPDIQLLIRQAIEKVSSKQLKLIRHYLNAEVTYFQIRLVLAKIGDDNES